MTNSVKRSKISQRSSKVVKLQYKFDMNDRPSLLEIDGKVYRNGTTVGDKKSADEELALFNKMYGEGFVVKVTSYAVYGYNKDNTNEISQAKKMLQSKDPRDVEWAKIVIDSKSRHMKTM